MNKLATTVITAVTIACGATAYAQLAQDVPHGFMIANYDIKDEATFKKYMDAAGPLAPRFGGKVIVFNMKAAAVEGQPRSVMAIAEFPSLADARRFYNSPEYTAARRFRTASTEGSVVITEGVAAPTS